MGFGIKFNEINLDGLAPHKQKKIRWRFFQRIFYKDLKEKILNILLIP